MFIANKDKINKILLPIKGLWSGVKLSGPHTVDRIPVVANVGHLLTALSICTPKTSQSSSYKLNASSFEI
jgi:hypothetical protein